MRENTATPSYIPALDGLRALSISLVLFGHGTIYDQTSHWLLVTGTHCGQTGVAVFFVISGYLITLLLLKEEAKAGQISLRGFYIRRILRIFPAFYFYLFVAAILSLVNLIPRIPIHDYIASLVFLRNVIGHAHETSHLWSLSLEEQFYLVWPSLMVFVRPSRRLLFGSVLIIVICLWRTTLVAFSAADVGALYMRPDLRLDSLLVGCVMALARQNEFLRKLGKQTLCWHGASGLFFAMLITWITYNHLIPLGAAVATLVTAMLIAVIMHWILENPSSITCRLLANPLLLFLGRLSFSLYLWQQLFFGPNASNAIYRKFPINLGCSLACAAFSYFLIERPFLSIKRNRFGSSVPITVSTDEHHSAFASSRL